VIHKSATYRIRVAGALDARWSARLGNMKIESDRSDPHNPVTALTGHLRDQSALSGVMNALYELHMPVLSVECLDSEAPSSTGEA
jgi:hypothetical protein